MKYQRWIVLGAIFAGLLMGPGSLESSAAAKPPIAWSHVPFAFVGSALGMLFVIGIQLLRKEPKYSLWGMRFLGLISVWFAASGLSAAALTICKGSMVPHAMLFLAVGTGSLLGVSCCWLLFSWKFRNAL